VVNKKVRCDDSWAY